jgi:hypothetical protein
LNWWNLKALFANPVVLLEGSPQLGRLTDKYGADINESVKPLHLSVIIVQGTVIFTQLLKELAQKYLFKYINPQ